MKMETYTIWEAHEYQNPLKGEFIPEITAYLHEEDEEVRPAFVIVPGGGYRMVAYGEGDIVARKFYEKGYNAFVVSYTIAMFEPIALGLQPLKDLARAVSYIRKHADELRIDPGKVSVCGFSAGGHLSASLAVHYDDERIRECAAYPDTEIRPDAVLLCYPVITSEKTFAHMDSFTALLGTEPAEAELEYMSVEKHVRPQTPPAFLWNTATDELVPMENACLFAKACKKNGVPFELHVFQDGPHGYSLADEEWASGEYGGEYTMKQWFAHLQYYIDRELELPAPFQELKLPKGTDYREMFCGSPKDYLKGKANPCVAVWPELADHWLNALYENK